MQTLRNTGPFFFPHFSLLIVRNWSWKCLNEGTFTLRFVWQFWRCDSCAQRCTEERDGIAAKLLRCGIASEALRRNMPLRKRAPTLEPKSQSKIWRTECAARSSPQICSCSLLLLEFGLWEPNAKLRGVGKPESKQHQLWWFRSTEMPPPPKKKKICSNIFWKLKQFHVCLAITCHKLSFGDLSSPNYVACESPTCCGVKQAPAPTVAQPTQLHAFPHTKRIQPWSVRSDFRPRFWLIASVFVYMFVYVFDYVFVYVFVSIWFVCAYFLLIVCRFVGLYVCQLVLSQLVLALHLVTKRTQSTKHRDRHNCKTYIHAYVSKHQQLVNQWTHRQAHLYIHMRMCTRDIIYTNRRQTPRRRTAKSVQAQYQNALENSGWRSVWHRQGQRRPPLSCGVLVCLLASVSWKVKEHRSELQAVWYCNQRTSSEIHALPLPLRWLTVYTLCQDIEPPGRSHRPHPW